MSTLTSLILAVTVARHVEITSSILSVSAAGGSESDVDAPPSSPGASLSLCLNLSSFELALDALCLGDMKNMQWV